MADVFFILLMWLAIIFVYSKLLVCFIFIIESELALMLARNISQLIVYRHVYYLTWNKSKQDGDKCVLIPISRIHRNKCKSHEWANKLYFSKHFTS